jgi:serine/threonine protein kinase
LEQQQKLRAYVSTHTKRRNASSRYVVKQLRKDLYLKKKTEAIKDLGREAKFLACLQHPNIVKLRGTVSNPGQADFMILLDYLQTTLSEQMVEWKQQQEPSVNFLIPWQSLQRIQQQANILSERLLALYDVAQAMRHLHQKL